MKIVAPDTNNFQLATEGDHTATLSGYEDLGLNPDPFNPGKKKHQIKLIFDLGNGIEQHMYVTATLRPLGKFYGVAAALLGANPGVVLEVEELVGLQCIVTIRHHKNNKGQQRSKITDARPVR